MVTLLAGIFIKDKENTSSPEVRQAYGMLTGIVGIFLNICLFAGKFIAGTISGSISITADAFNNLSDAGSSFVTLIGFKLAGAKPDPDHPFGHGRIEYVSGLIVSGVILLMAFELIKNSVDKIIHPTEVEFSLLAMGILVASILVKIYMYFYNHKIAGAIDSSAMNATASDSFGDVLATFVVLLSSVIGWIFGLAIDGWCGLLVAIFIFYSGVSSARDTINPLLGQAPDPEFVTKIRSIVLSHPQIMGIHDLLVHDYGPGRRMISLHAEVNAQGSFVELHDLIDNIERELQQKLSCSAVIHMDPVITDDPEINELRHKVTDIVYRLDEQLTLHDFRIIRGPTHTNVIFDVVVPFHFKMTDAQLRSWLDERIKQIDPSYFCVINIDKN